MNDGLLFFIGMCVTTLFACGFFSILAVGYWPQQEKPQEKPEVPELIRFADRIEQDEYKSH
jgi:hypothetical protein